MPVKYIFWDNDGVLVDTEHLYFRATSEILRTIGIELTRETFIEISLKEGKSVFSLARQMKYSDKHVEELRRLRNDRYAALLRRGVEAIAGVEATLRILQDRFRMAIVTSSRRDHFDLIHRNTGLTGYFDFVLTREDYAHSKPHPEPYLKAIERCGLGPEECMVVEDSERGLLAAVSAGLRCLVVPSELTRENDFSEAEKVLNGVHEIPEFLM